MPSGETKAEAASGLAGDAIVEARSLEKTERSDFVLHRASRTGA